MIATKKIKILIADKHCIFCAGLKSLLRNQPNIIVVGESIDEKDTLKKTLKLSPHLLLTELSTSKKIDTKIISYIKKVKPETKILALTMQSSENHVNAALNAGVDGYILKKDSYQELLKAIASVANGKMYLSPSICNSATHEYLNQTNTTAIEKHNDTLTNREIEIIKLIASGYRNKDIAAFLSISNKTVIKHRFNLMHKLNLHNMCGVTTYAIKNKIN